MFGVEDVNAQLYRLTKSRYYKMVNTIIHKYMLEQAKF